ncbi:armadillo-type protein [Cladochytrium replicatum]|nr:armadillo-type protein [Cladochytrium replicatum]
MMATDEDWDGALIDSSLDDDIKGTDEIKLTSRLYKTADEIARFTVEEGLGEIERAIYLICHGVSVQKMSVIHSLPRLLTERNRDCTARLLPLLLERITTDQSHQVRVSLAHVLSDWMRKAASGQPEVAQWVVPAAKRMMLSKDEATVEAWADLQIACVQHVPRETLEAEFIPVANGAGGAGVLAQPVQTRIWMCRVLGALAGRVDPDTYRAVLLQRAKEFCQDTDGEVRTCMCRQLNLIARALGLETTKEELLKEYQELMIDEEDTVAENALYWVMELSSILDAATKTEFLVPLWRRICEERPDALIETMLAQFGTFFKSSFDQIPDGEKRVFLSFYHRFSTDRDESYRIACAPNFSSIASAVGPGLYDTFKLDRQLQTMVNDSSIEVRKRVAASLHTIAQALRSSSQRLLRSAFLTLLGDSDRSVFATLCSNIGAILTHFSSDPTSRSIVLSDELLFLLLRKEREWAADAFGWRTHRELVLQFKAFPDFFSSHQISEHCVPLLFKLLHENTALPVKKAVIKVVCNVLKKMRGGEERNSIRRQIVELKEAASYGKRILFLKLSKHMMKHFSLRFIKEQGLFDATLDLHKDPVPNVRLRLAKMLRTLRMLLRPPPAPGKPFGPTEEKCKIVRIIQSPQQKLIVMFGL